MGKIDTIITTIVFAAPDDHNTYVDLYLYAKGLKHIFQRQAIDALNMVRAECRDMCPVLKKYLNIYVAKID